MTKIPFSSAKSPRTRDRVPPNLRPFPVLGTLYMPVPPNAPEPLVDVPEPPVLPLPSVIEAKENMDGQSVDDPLDLDEGGVSYNHGLVNYSAAMIIDPDDMVEPRNWFQGRKFYVVTRGTAVGIFITWGAARGHVEGVPTCSHLSFRNWHGALEYWAENVRNNDVVVLPRTSQRMSPSYSPSPMRHSSRGVHTSPAVTRSAAVALPLVPTIPPSPIYVPSTAPTPVRRVAPAGGHLFGAQRLPAVPASPIYVPSTATTPDCRSARTTPAAPAKAPPSMVPAGWPAFENPAGWPDLGDRAAWSLPSGAFPPTPGPNAPYAHYWLTRRGAIGAGHNAPVSRTVTPCPQTLPARILVPDTPAQNLETPVKRTGHRGPVSLFLTPKGQRGPAIVIPDDDDEEDSEIEATEPRPIDKKLIDEYELTDDETGAPILRQTYDAATNTYIVDEYIVSEDEDGIPYVRKVFDARAPQTVPRVAGRQYRILTQGVLTPGVLTPAPVASGSGYRVETPTPVASGSGRRTQTPAPVASQSGHGTPAPVSGSVAPPANPPVPASASQKPATKALSARAAGKARQI